MLAVNVKVASSRGGTGYSFSLRGNFINLLGNSLTQMTSETNAGDVMHVI